MITALFCNVGLKELDHFFSDRGKVFTCPPKYINVKCKKKKVSKDHLLDIRGPCIPI